MHGWPPEKQKKERKNMNELAIFNFEENEVRTQLINEEPWFVAKDVYDVLRKVN